MIKYFITAFVILLFGCESLNIAEVRNSSKEPIILTIHYDKERMDSLFRTTSSGSSVKSINSEASTSGFHYDFDTTNLVIKYTMPQGKSFRLYGGMGGIFHYRPDLYLFKEIDITNSTGTKYYLNKSFDTLFKKVSAGEYVIEVK